MTKEEFLKLDEETQRGIITDLAELWAKNTKHKEKRSAFICLANSEDEEKNENKNYIRRERVYGKVERSFYLGDLDQDKIDAEFKNGILNIVVPKKEETSNKKRIEIK